MPSCLLSYDMEYMTDQLSCEIDCSLYHTKQLYMATVSNHVTQYLKFSITVNYQWDDDEVRFVPDQHAEFDFYSASSLKQQSAGRHVAPLGHIILIPSQPVFALSP